MNKKEFLSELQNRLKILKKSEVDDILTEYSQHIDMKIESGLTEEEAIKDFGNIDELVAEILDAYNVNASYGKTKFEDRVFDWTRKAADYINVLTESLLEKDRKEILGLLVKAVITAVCLSLVALLVELCSNMVASIFGIFPHFIYQPFSILIHFIFSLAYIALVLYVVYVFINHYIITSTAREKHREKVESQEDAAASVYADPSFSEKHPSDKKRSELKKWERKREKKMEGEKRQEGNLLLDLFTICMKVVAVLILIPVLMGTVAVIIACGVGVVMACMGYGVIGISVILLGCGLIGCCVGYGLLRFVINQKKEVAAQ